MTINALASESDTTDAGAGLDVVDLDGAVSEASTDDAVRGAAARPTGRRSARRSTSNARAPRRSQKIRRIAEQVMSVAWLDAATCALLAVALEMGNPPSEDAYLDAAGDVRVELAVAVLEDARDARTALAAVVELASVDDLEAGVLATGMVAERVAFRRVWSVLRCLDPSLPAAIPSKATQAGATVARCARGLTKAKRTTLERAIGVLA